MNASNRRPTEELSVSGRSEEVVASMRRAASRLTADLVNAAGRSAERPVRSRVDDLRLATARYPNLL